MAELKGGSTAGGYEIVTKKEVPMIFRVNAGVLQYSTNDGATWTNARFVGDATAVASQILAPATAYDANGNKITGTIPTLGSEEYPGWRRALVSQPSSSGRIHLYIPRGNYNGTGNAGEQGVFADDPEFTPDNVSVYANVFGMQGTLQPGQPYATGVSTPASTGSATWTITVSGLSFTPKIVYANLSGYMSYYAQVGDYPYGFCTTDQYSTQAIKTSGMSNSVPNNQVYSGGFKLIIAQNAYAYNLPTTWYAYG